MKGTIVISAVLFAFLMAGTSHALSCIDVDLCVAPCVHFLQGHEPSPSADCCAGVKKLKSLPTDTAEKQFACNCVKTAAARLSNLDDNAIKTLPTACGAPLPFPISLAFDCSTIP